MNRRSFLFSAASVAPLAQAAGWKSLFDGKSFANWVDPRKKSPPGDAWTIEDGCIKAQPNPRITEDLVSANAYGDFEFEWEWKIQPAGNSGVKYRIQDFVLLGPEVLKAGGKFERQVDKAIANRLDRGKLSPTDKAQVYVVGFEYQMIDDAGHSDARRGGLYQAGGLYAMRAPSSPTVGRKAGEWNQARLLVRGVHTEHWLNGVKVVECNLDEPDIKAGVEKRWGTESQVFKMLTEIPKRSSSISLQNHGNHAWFRNLRIRNL